MAACQLQVLKKPKHGFISPLHRRLQLAKSPALPRVHATKETR